MSEVKPHLYINSKGYYVTRHSYSGSDTFKGDDEEERIYYVAITRPIDYLRISFAGTPSVYLRKYLTEEILDKLREHAEEVDRLQEQVKLLGII